MALIHFNVSVTAAARDLKTAANLLDSEDKPIQSLSIQADAANTGAVFVGGPGVTTTNYLFRIPIPVTNIPTAPYVWEGAMRPPHLSEIFIIGTAGDVVHVGGMAW